MRNLKSYRYIVIALIMTLCINIVGYSHEYSSDLDFDENLSTPKIKEKYHATITSAQKKLGKHLIANGFNVETTRNGLVLIISIPAQEIFKANETDICFDETLDKISKSISSPQFYKFLLAMHCDNTGNELYRDNLTTDRIIAIYDWFTANAPQMKTTPYAMADSEPIDTNNSMSGRKNNRRLEIYIVPNLSMIENIAGK